MSLSAGNPPSKLASLIPELRHPIAAACAGLILAGWIVAVALGAHIAPHGMSEFVSDETFAPISSSSFLGTDYLGRDMLSRVLIGARITIGVAVLATFLAYTVGGTLGMLAAIQGGWYDFATSRVVEVALSLPKMIVALVVIAAVGPSIGILAVLAGLIYAAGVFRIVRALSADVMVLDFVRAARARGEGVVWLAFGEILPNIAMPLAVDFALRLSFAILFISSLSFLGLGVQPPLADWGGLVRENLSGLGVGSFAALYPAFAIASVSVALNLLVDAFGTLPEAGKES
jgi:peptide/nickel transport system permease protein